jgi:membrane protein
LWHNVVMIDWDFFLKYKPLKFIIRLYQKAFHDDIFSRAAQVAFYFSFAIFPLLLFLVTLFGLILDSTTEYQKELFDYLRQIMPKTAFELVKNTIIEVAENSSTGKLTFGFLVAIWSASAAIDSLRAALNYVYSLKETRYYWTTKSLSLALTAAIGTLFLLALGIIFYGGHLITYLFDYFSIVLPSDYILILLKIIIAFVVVKILFAVIYNLLPNHQRFRWDWTTTGANVGIILWLILSFSFRLYLQYFDTYARTYGSLGAMIVLMLWLYLTALVILIGGAINAILIEIREKNDEKKESLSVDL